MEDPTRYLPLTITKMDQRIHHFHHDPTQLIRVFNTTPLSLSLDFSLGTFIEHYICHNLRSILSHIRNTELKSDKKKKKKKLKLFTMGNYTSCCSSPHKSNSKSAMLIDVNRNFRRVKVPITAAELMLEDPGYIVSPVEDLRRMFRVSAMKADDELLAGKLYMLLPASRLNCVVSDLEMAIVESGCEKRSSSRRGSSKVLPAAPEVVGEKMEGVSVGDSSEEDTGFCGKRFGNYRQYPWKPALEPIFEFEGC